jgi:hypothetical protein
MDFQKLITRLLRSAFSAIVELATYRRIVLFRASVKGWSTAMQTDCIAFGERFGGNESDRWPAQKD